MPESKPKDNHEVFDLERIKSLVQLMEEHGLSEVDLRNDKQRIRLNRGISQTVVQQAVAPPMAAPAPASATPSTATGASDATSPAEDHIVLIKSPMVGTFYSRPNPEAKPFVEVGDRVSSDQTVCIIEAMKVFNPIPAEISGTIVARLVEDEEPVDFDKPLFKVDTSK